MVLRLLHTADWHLGASLHGHDRFDEHAAFLRWLLDQLDEQAIDALIVAGDVLDKIVSPASAYQQLYDFLAAALERRPALDVVIVAGNHDPASRLEAPAAMLRKLSRVHVVGTYDEHELGKLVVPLHDATGRVAARAVAMPFLRAADRWPGESTTDCLRRIYDAAFAVARRELAADGVGDGAAGHALVAVGHCHLQGGRISEGSERGILRGGEEAVPSSAFPDDVAYVALGHLHLAQHVGDPRIRYSGSPIPLAMSERDYEHSVTLVELDGARLLSTRLLRVPRTVPFVSITASLAELPSALRALPARGAEVAPFLELVVPVEGPTPSLRRDVERLLERYAARLVRVHPRSEHDDPLTSEPTRRRLDQLTPGEVFARLYEAKHGNPPSEALSHAFDDLLDGVRELERDASVELAKEAVR